MRFLAKTASVLALATSLAVIVPSPSHAQATINAMKVAQSGPLLDPEATSWKSARDVDVALQPQTVTAPMNPAPAVKQIRVRAIHNDKWLALRIQWRDLTRNDELLSDTFGDQVAVEFPINGAADALPTPMMGNDGGRVNILQWRAALQRDLQQGPPTVRRLYPNAQDDVYPDQILTAADSLPYQGAIAVDNAVSRAHFSPVLDQVAEGWGTLTVKQQQRADGRGSWRNGQWTVVIALPMSADGPDSPGFIPGTKTMVAFAVWEGAHHEVGSRKSWSDWTPIEISK